MKDFIYQLAVTIKKGDVKDIPRVEAGDVIAGVLATAYWAAGIATVAVIIIGGILYATSDGDAAKVKRAKDAILYSVVGLIFIMMAVLITNYVVGWF